MFYLTTTDDPNIFAITQNADKVINARAAVAIGDKEDHEISKAAEILGFNPQHAKVEYWQVHVLDAPYIQNPESSTSLPPVFYSVFRAQPRGYIIGEGCEGWAGGHRCRKYTYDLKAWKKQQAREAKKQEFRRNRPLTVPQLRVLGWKCAIATKELLPAYDVRNISSFGMTKPNFRQLIIDGFIQLRSVKGSSAKLVDIRAQVSDLRGQILRDPELAKAVGFRTTK